MTMLNRLHTSNIRHFVASSSRLDLAKKNIHMIDPLITFSWEKVQSWLK